MTEPLTRRRLLATIGTGVAVSVAGCGYQPGRGDLAWEMSMSSLWRGHDPVWLTDRTTLFRVSERTRPVLTDGTTVTAIASDGEQRWYGTTELSLLGTPAIADDAVFVPLDDQTVVRIDGESTEDDTLPSPVHDDETEIDETAWSTAWDFSQPPTLAASTEFVIGIDRETIVGFDTDDGTERFQHTIGAEPIAAASAPRAVAVEADRGWLELTPADGSGPTVVTIDSDGDVRATLSLPAAADWFDAITLDGEPTALAIVEGDLRTIDSDGEQTTLPIDRDLSGGDDVAIVDSDNHRLYYTSERTVGAVDIGSGDHRWSDAFPTLDGPLVADATGVYGLTSESGECAMVGVTADGTESWELPLLDELACEKYVLVDDRLIVIDPDDQLYGFRTSDGSRLSVL